MVPFGILRILFGLFGAWVTIGAAAGAWLAVGDREWAHALGALLLGIVGVWFIRVGIYGTFNGQPLAGARSPDQALWDRRRRW